MIVQCPRCQTKYRLDEAVVSEDGTPVRCSRCKEVFEVTPETANSEAPPPVVEEKEPLPPQSDLDEDFLGLFDEESGKTASAQKEGKARAAEGQSPGDGEDTPGGESPGSEQKKGKKSKRKRKTKEPKQKKGSKRTLVLLIILLLLAIGAAVYFYFPTIQPYLPAWVTERFVQSPETGYVQKAEDTGQSIENIALLDVRQYFVTNEKIGQLFVIEGRAVNNYPETKELIKLQATLYDGTGTKVESKQFLCGNTVSLFQLQVLSKDELNSALQSKVGILTNNTNVQPGEEVPFMTVFYSPPESVQEFGVKVVEVKEPGRN